MVVNYDPDLEQKLPDLEVLRLRTEIAELKSQLDSANKVLEENDLAEAKPKQLTDGEIICHSQIAILKVISDRGLPLSNEDVKNLDTLVKTLLAIQGKAVPVSGDKKKKKDNGAKVADLLAIVNGNG